MKNEDVYVVINATKKATEFGIPVRDIINGLARAKFFSKTIEHRRVINGKKQLGFCPECGEEVSAEKDRSELHHEQSVRKAVEMTLNGDFQAVDAVTGIDNLSVVHPACHSVIEERKRANVHRKCATPNSSCCRQMSSRRSGS